MTGLVKFLVSLTLAPAECVIRSSHRSNLANVPLLYCRLGAHTQLWAGTTASPAQITGQVRALSSRPLVCCVLAHFQANCSSVPLSLCTHGPGVADCDQRQTREADDRVFGRADQGVLSYAAWTLIYKYHGHLIINIRVLSS